MKSRYKKRDFAVVAVQTNGCRLSCLGFALSFVWVSPAALVCRVVTCSREN